MRIYHFLAIYYTPKDHFKWARHARRKRMNKKRDKFARERDLTNKESFVTIYGYEILKAEKRGRIRAFDAHTECIHVGDTNATHIYIITSQWRREIL